MNRPSWSSLNLWRGCPYRFLLERGFDVSADGERFVVVRLASNAARTSANVIPPVTATRRKRLFE